MRDNIVLLAVLLLISLSTLHVRRRLYRLNHMNY